MIECIVKNITEGKTLKSYIMDMYPQLKQSTLQKALKNGDIKVNGERQRKNIALNDDDQLKIYITDEELGTCPPLEIVYEDENLMIVNKMAGISCFDDKNTGAANILTQVEAHMRDRGQYNADILNVPYLCHRLDHHTGGLLVFAKHEHSYKFLMDAFTERRIRKFYQTIVCGHPEPAQAQLHDFLVKDAAAAHVKIFKSQVKNAVPIFTRYATLGTKDDLTRLEVELVTGRTHQIRAHLAYYGYPVLGDDKYGDRKLNKKYGASYQALWATRLLFNLGTGHFMEYLNKQSFETTHIVFPDFVEELVL
jgi:23S rRNA pseudouridine955/2504/2580 synthase